MIKILFVCLGNICRSPMAEFIMKDLVEKRNLKDKYEIASAATSTEEIGNPVYPAAKRKLKEHDITCEGKTARQLRRSDYRYYDYIVGMDDSNMRNIRRMLGEDTDGKIFKLLEFCDDNASVADPWYTGDFDKAWDDIYRGCNALLEHVENK